jgi:hypothetical protein
MRRFVLAVAFMLAAAPVLAQGVPVKFLSSASTNSTLVKAGRVELTALNASNSTATAYFLKLYDKATAPICNVDVPKLTLVVPPIANGGQATPDLGGGLLFSLGLGFCLTGAISDSDNSNAATGVAINFGMSGRP